MNNIFAAIGLAFAAISAVTNVLHLVQSPDPLTGPGLLTAVAPVLADIQILVPKAKIPDDLALDVANAVADAVNRYYKKQG